MTDKPSLERPRPVTTAAFLVVAGSVLLVFTLMETLGSLRGTDMRQSVEEILAEPPGNGLGISVDQVLDALHVLGLVAGALAAAAFVLGIFVWQGHRGARTALTVVTVLLVMTMPVSGVMPVLLAIAIGMLWSRPARDWFNGVAPTESSSSAGGKARPAAPAASGRLRSDAGGPPPGRPAVPPPAPSAPPSSGGWQPKPAGGWQPRPAAGWGAPGSGQPGSAAGQQVSRATARPGRSSRVTAPLVPGSRPTGNRRRTASTGSRRTGRAAGVRAAGVRRPGLRPGAWVGQLDRRRT